MPLFDKDYVERTFTPVDKADRDYSPFDHGTEVKGSYKPSNPDGKAMSSEELAQYYQEWEEMLKDDITNDSIIY